MEAARTPILADEEFGGWRSVPPEYGHQMPPDGDYDAAAARGQWTMQKRSNDGEECVTQRKMPSGATRGID